MTMSYLEAILALFAIVDPQISASACPKSLVWMDLAKQPSKYSAIFGKNPLTFIALSDKLGKILKGKWVYIVYLLWRMRCEKT